MEALPEPSYNLHDFRWENALATGRKIFGEEFPKDITVYLIEAENLDFGFELSPVIQQAGDRVFQDLVQLITNN